jgi:hypothetical protein
VTDAKPPAFAFRASSWQASGAGGASGVSGVPQIHPDFVGIHLRALNGARGDVRFEI